VDLLRFIGGHFADGRIIALNLHRSSIPHVFGTRSAAMILRETNQIVPFLSDLHTAFDAEHTRQVTSQALVEELVSLWNGVSLYDKQFLREQVAQDCQHLADVVSIIADNANDRVFADSGQGRQLETGQRQPTTAIEALRWINGYFAQKHARPRS